jgi:hypothetical protein
MNADGISREYARKLARLAACVVPGVGMSLFRSLSATLLSAAASFSIVTASGCGTNAIGVDDCRDIEQARCEASVPCGFVDDVKACRRYYRDHCLHGLLTKPSAGAVAECVRVIDAAGECASADPEAALGACDPEVTDGNARLSSACDVVAHPEYARECAFLLDEPPDTSSGGQPATGGRPSTDEPAGGTGASEPEPTSGAGGGGG